MDRRYIARLVRGSPRRSHLLSPGGGTGRRAGFRCQWSNPWRFESSPGHQNSGMHAIILSSDKIMACIPEIWCVIDYAIDRTPVTTIALQVKNVVFTRSRKKCHFFRGTSCTHHEV